MINIYSKQKTRNQRKREAVKTAVMAVLFFILFSALTVWALGVWAEHPGEQFVSGSTYSSLIKE